MDLGLDDNLDLNLSDDGDLVLVSGEDEVRQDAESLYNTQRGEWFLDPDEGMDWLGVVFDGTKHLSTEAIDTELKRVTKDIVSSPRLVGFESSREGSQYTATLSLSVLTEDGESVVELEVDVDDDGADAYAFVLGA